MGYKHKIIFTFSLIILLVTGISLHYLLTASSFEEELAVSVYYDNCYIEQIRTLVPILEARNQWTPYNFNSDLFAENFDVTVGKWVSDRDPRINRIHELQLILIEAKHTVNTKNGIYDSSSLIITGFGTLLNSNYSYRVMLISEDYLPLKDLIIEFADIPENQLEITVTGVFRPLVRTLFGNDLV